MRLIIRTVYIYIYILFGKKQIHECWKCRKKDHRKADCYSKAKEKDRKEDDKKADGSVNVIVEDEVFSFTKIFTGTMFTLKMSSWMGWEVNSYNSGVSGYMSPSQHHFITFKDIMPCEINTTDKKVFKATGIGNTKISIPSGKMTIHIPLKGVLLS